MRISIVEGDSGYNTWQDFTRARITLDGKEIHDVLTADEMLGFVLVYDTNSYGYRFDVDGNYITKKLYGRVVINFD